MNTLAKLALAGAVALTTLAGAQASEMIRSTILSKDVDMQLTLNGHRTVPVRKILQLGPNYKGTFVKRVIAEGTGCGQLAVIVNGLEQQGSHMTICSHEFGLDISTSVLNYELGRGDMKTLQLRLIQGSLNLTKVGVVVADDFDPWSLRQQLQTCQDEKANLSLQYNTLFSENSSLRSENLTMSNSLSQTNYSLEQCREQKASFRLENNELRKAYERLARRCDGNGRPNPPRYPGNGRHR